MSVNLLTIANILDQQTASPNSELMYDASAENTRTFTAHLSEQTSDEIHDSKQSRYYDEAAYDSNLEDHNRFREFIDKQTKDVNAEKNHETTPEKNESKDSTQPEATPVENPQNSKLTGEQNKEESADTIELNTRQKLADLIEGAKGNKTQPEILNSQNSSDIDLISNSAKNIAASQTVSTEAIKNQSTADQNQQTADATSLTTLNDPKISTSDTAKVNIAEELSLDAITVNTTKTSDSGEQTTSVENSGKVSTETLPANTSELLTDQIPDSGNVKNNNTQNVNTLTNANAEVASTTQETSTENSAINADKAYTEDLLKEIQQAQSSSESNSEATDKQTSTKQAGTLNSKAVQEGIYSENLSSKTTDVQLPADQNQSGNNSGSADSYQNDTTQIFAQNTTNTSFTEQTNTFTAAAETTNISAQSQSITDNGPAPIGNQILEAVRSSMSNQNGDKEITIQLNPPELGKVSVKFQEQGTEITGTLEVSKAQTRAEIEHALPEMLRGLADSGVAIKRLEVVLSQDNQPGQQSARDPLFQDGQFQQQDHSNPGQSDERQHTTQTSYGPTARSRYQYSSTSDPYEMLVTNNSINMLV